MEIYKYNNRIQLIIDPIYESISYIIDKKFLIDCGYNINWKEINLKIEAVFLTHGHLDHCYSARYLDVPIYIHEEDLKNFEKINSFFWSKEKINIIKDKLEPLKEAPFEIIETPGHTPGSVCYYFEGYLFTGDTVFDKKFQILGRTDLPLSSKKELLNSLEKLKNIGFKKLFPGHGRFI
jgi:glyoxylase-like metal-dependent hydrolase (beta-lactamase superfamily II)